MLKSVENIVSILREFNTIFFYCVDPGAFNVMYPVAEAIKEDSKNITWILDGWCKTNKQSEIPSAEWETFETGCKAKGTNNVCLVLGSQTNFNKTHHAISFCKINNIFSLFLFDHWVHYLEHFWDADSSTLYLPDKICVMDEAARNALIKQLYPLLRDKSYVDTIAIVGHPAIEKAVHTIHEIPEEISSALKKQLNPQGKKLILFLLEPVQEDFGYDAYGKPSLGYTEYTILTCFLDNYPLNNAKVIIKPHPRQDIVEIKKFLAPCRKYDLEVIETESLEQLVAIADEVVGITTVALIIASKAGKPIKSIQVGRNSKGAALSNEYFENNLII